MDPDILDGYWKAITVIEAQDVLVKLQIADYPHLKKKDHVEVHKRYHKMAYPKMHEKETLTTEELFERLQRAMK